jgi:hypothetical protein
MPGDDARRTAPGERRLTGSRRAPARRCGWRWCPEGTGATRTAAPATGVQVTVNSANMPFMAWGGPSGGGPSVPVVPVGMKHTAT